LKLNEKIVVAWGKISGKIHLSTTEKRIWAGESPADPGEDPDEKVFATGAPVV